MISRRRDRPQNRDPEALIRARKEVAARNLAAVRATVQAMRRRDEPKSGITPKAVARESGVSVKTIYRRDDLFALIARANPAVRRRPSEAAHAAQRATLEQERDAARQEAAYHQQAGRLVAIGDRGAQAQTAQYKAQVARLKAEVEQLRSRLAACTCEAAAAGPRPVEPADYGQVSAASADETAT